MNLARIGPLSLSLLLVATGCADDEPEASVTSDSGARSDAGMNVDSGLDAASCEQWAEDLTSCDSLNLSCEQRGALASTWIAQFTDCVDDSDCRMVALECPSPFLCGTAISSDADADAIQNVLRRLHDQHADQGCHCAVADCGPVVATCSERKCTAVLGTF